MSHESVPAQWPTVQQLVWAVEEVTIVIVSKQRLEQQPHTSTSPHSHTDKGAYQSCDWAKVKCLSSVRIVTMSRAMSDNDNESW